LQRPAEVAGSEGVPASTPPSVILSVSKDQLPEMPAWPETKMMEIREG
jgi:hypothetical protein